MPPEKKKYKVSRQSLADFSATVEAKPNLSEEELFAKFPEFNSDRDLLQSALDYHTTKKSGKYKTDQELDAKFPEFEFEAPTPQDTENMVRQFAQEQQRNKKGYAIDKKFEPEIKSWIDNEVSTARSLAQAEFNTWSKAREQQLKAKGLQGEALEMALSKEQGSKLDEINKRLDTDLSTKYKSKLEEFENLTLNAPPKASATATMAPKKDAGVFASFGKQIANVFANTLPGSVAAMTAAELPSTLDEWKVGGRRSPNFNKSINHLIEDKSRFGEKDDPVDRAMLNSLKRTKDFLGKDNYNDSLYDPQSKEAMFADFFKEEIRKEKQNLLAEAKKQKEEAGELLKDVPTSWDDAKKAGNISGYVSGAIGQGLGTTGIALATAGVGAFVLEAGEIYQEANAEKAKYLSKIWGVNVTPEDVVLYGEDTDSRNAARIGGVINAGLEFLGGKLGLSKFAKAMVGKKIVGNLVSSGVMGAGGEGATELVQEMVNIIAARTAGKNPDLLQSRDWDRLIESARQGAIAGGTFASVGSTVSQANEKVQEIGNLIDQVGLPGMEYTQLQNQIFSDAVQKQAAGQVPIQSGAGSSQKMAQGKPQTEPQAAAQAGSVVGGDVKSKLENEGFKPTLKPNGANEFILVVDDTKPNGKRSAGVIGLKTIEIGGKKFLSIGMTNVREGYEGKGLATNMYRYLMENLPEGYDGILSPKETRWNNEQIPKIHEKLSKEYDKTELDNGDIVFKNKAVEQSLQATPQAGSVVGVSGSALKDVEDFEIIGRPSLEKKINSIGEAPNLEQIRGEDVAKQKKEHDDKMAIVDKVKGMSEKEYQQYYNETNPDNLPSHPLGLRGTKQATLAQFEGEFKPTDYEVSDAKKKHGEKILDAIGSIDNVTEHLTEKNQLTPEKQNALSNQRKKLEKQLNDIGIELYSPKKNAPLEIGKVKVVESDKSGSDNVVEVVRLGLIDKKTGQVIKEAEVITGKAPTQYTEAATAPQEGLTFTTERGSVYTVDGQRTTRNKAQREGQEDFGPKPQSFATVYLTPEDAQRAQIIYTGGVQSRTIDRQGDEVVVTDVLDNGSIKTTKFPYQKTPQVGLHPFEVFEDGGAHLGNKITSISGQPVATPSGIKEAQTTQTIPDQVQVEEPTGGTTEDKLQPFSKVKQRQVRDLEKADETTFTEKGRQIIDRAFESGLIDEQQSRSLSALLNNASGKNATPRSRKQFFDALRTDLKLPVDQRTNQIKARIADIKSKILGMRMEKKITKARLAEVKSVTDPMFKDLDIPSSKAKRAMKRILGTNFGSDLQVERLAGYLTDLARGIEADMIYDEAEQAKAALQKSKGKAISNLTPAIDKILKLDIRNVEDLGEYIDNVKNILNGLNPAKKGYAPTNEAQAIQYAEKAFAQESNAKRERLTDLGIPTEGVADEDLDGILSFAEEKDILPTKGDQHRQHLEQQFEYSALAIEELADELAEKGDNKLKKIIAIDPASFNSNKDLAMAIRVLDYIAQNGYDPKVGVGNLGVLEAKIELDEAIPKMPKLEGASLPNLTVNFIDTVRAKGFMQALRRLAGTVETATKLSVLAGFNERMQSAAKASGVVAKATRAMEDVFDAAKKAGYKLNTVPAVRRTNMIGMLLSYPEGANKYAYFDRMKANLAQSLETMKDDPKSSKFYDDDKKALDEFAKIPNRDEFEAHVNKKYPWEMKLLATGQGVLAERFSDFAKKSLEYFNEYVGKQEGYFGSFRFKRRMPLPNDAQIRSTSKPRSANSAIQRQYTIDRDAYYDLNFTENVLRTLKEQSDVIDTAHGQTKSNMFLKDPRAVEILGGTENYAKINQIYKGMSDAFLGKGAHHEGNYTLWSKAATLGGDAIRAFVFSGVPAFVKGIKYFHTRYWKQFMPTIMNSTVQMAMKKPESVKFLFTHIPPNLKLLEDKPIKLRSRVLGGLAVDNMDFGTSVINFEAQFLDRWNAQIKKVLVLTSAGQIEGDVDSVTRNWIAYYLEYLDSKGIKDAKLEEEHLYDDDVRKEAAAYAQNMVDLVHGESQTETAGLWYRDPNAAIKLLKIIAFPFSGFMMKQKDRLADNIAIMKDPSTSKVAKTEAFRDSMAIASENVTFATMAVAIRAMFEVGSVAAAEAMGMIPPEEDKEKWWERTWTGMVFNTMLDLIPSWAVLNNDIRNFIAEHVNDIRYRLEKQQDPFLTRKDFKDSGKELYVDPNGSNYGGFSILAAPFDATREAFKTDYDEKTYTQTDENLESFSTYLTDEQTNLIYTNAIISLTAPILGSDLKTISHKITQGQLKQIKEEIKEGKDAAN